MLDGTRAAPKAAVAIEERDRDQEHAGRPRPLPPSSGKIPRLVRDDSPDMTVDARHSQSGDGETTDPAVVRFQGVGPSDDEDPSRDGDCDDVVVEGTFPPPDAVDDDDDGPSFETSLGSETEAPSPLAASAPSPAPAPAPTQSRRRHRPVGAPPPAPKHSQPRRCYRLNLERPFDIHCEPSPLEYGDYMTPWGAEQLPLRAGPVEYCPPRHLGGRAEVWRELLRWGREETTDDDGKEADETQTTEEERVGGWRRLTPAEALAVRKLGEKDPNNGEYTFETYDLSHVVGDWDVRMGSGREQDGGLECSGRSGGGDIHVDLDELSIRDSVRSNNGLATLKEDSMHHHDRDRDRDRDHDQDAIRDPHDGVGISSGSSSSEEAMHPNALFAARRVRGKHDEMQHAEDLLSHLPSRFSSSSNFPFRIGAENCHGRSHSPRQSADQPFSHSDPPSADHPSLHLPPPPPPPDRELHTVLSLDSDTSREQILRLKTDEELANDTARLFRRSELSLREAREREEEERRRIESEAKLKKEREETERLEKERSEGGGHSRTHSNGSGGHLRRKSSLSLGSTKKLLRSLSKVMAELNGTPSNAHSNNRTGSGAGAGVGGGERICSSLQAATIEKARDLIDDDDDDDDCEGSSEDDTTTTTKKQHLNISLYIIGEYDVLNDLVNDGAKRLSRGKDASDWELLMQNEPCPPPDRWVRPTGWIRCNPSCGYAAFPPKGYVVGGAKNKVRIAELEETKKEKGDVTRSLSSSTSTSRRSSDNRRADDPADARREGKAASSSPPPDPPVSESDSSPKHSYGTHATDSTAAPSTSTEGDGDGGDNEGVSSGAAPDGSSRDAASSETPSLHPADSPTLEAPVTPIVVSSARAAPAHAVVVSKAAAHFNAQPSVSVNDAVMASATKARKSLGKRFAIFGKKNKR
ncbi:hypothetical protein ACHAXS_006466 [Conticribra weissflogii]